MAGLGNSLFVATDDARGIVRPALISRLAAPHILATFSSQAGWDWSLLLTLGALQQCTGLAKIADGEDVAR